MGFSFQVDSKKFAEELSRLRDYHYQVWDYTVSLRQLLIRVVALSGDRPLYLHFRTVLYMRLPTTWDGAELTCASGDECSKLLNEIDVGEIFHRPQLFYIEKDRLIVQIVCYIHRQKRMLAQ